MSRVRSLELDDWSNELVATMTSIGNRMINTVYEATHKAQNRVKPSPNSNRLVLYKKDFSKGKLEPTETRMQTML